MSSSDKRNSKNGKGLQTPTASISHVQRFACFCVSFVCIGAISLTSYPEVIQSYTHSRGDIVAKFDDIITVPLQPKVDNIQGLDHHYLKPKHGKPKGLLIFLHSCKRSGLEFFHLPEDRIIAYDALQKGLAVLSPTSQHRESGCFTQMDVPWIEQVVDEFANRHHLTEVPRVGLAVSSGASFLFFVYKALKLASMAIYNSPQSFHVDDIEQNLAIPTVYVTMPLDKIISRQVESNYNDLQKADVPTQLYKATPRPFTSVLCMARFPEMLPKVCDEIFDIIHKDYPQLLDADGFVKESMKSGQWQQLLSKLEVDYQNRSEDGLYYQTETAHSGHSWMWAVLEQEVRTCQAYHAMTAEHHSGVLEFLIQQAGIGS